MVQVAWEFQQVLDPSGKTLLRFSFKKTAFGLAFAAQMSHPCPRLVPAHTLAEGGWRSRGGCVLADRGWSGVMGFPLRILYIKGRF